MCGLPETRRFEEKDGIGMKPNTVVKRCVDLLMVIGLLFVSGYQFWGEAAHEWAGAGLFVLCLVHNLLNCSWYRNLFKGKYTPLRIIQLCVNILLLVSMALQMYSGILMSRYAFAFLPVKSGLVLARRLHILGAYWGILLMSLHLGLHWNMILGMVKRSMTKTGMAKTDAAKNGAAQNSLGESRPRLWTLAGLLVAIYGGSVFVKRDFAPYLFLKSEFVFLDYNEPVWLFYLDYLALMGLCIFAAHYGAKVCRRMMGRG